MRHIFMDLLLLADQGGVVDMTVSAISRRVNVPIELVADAIEKLKQPDPHSRSQVEDGKRLVPIDKDRDWGWIIVNYEYYRKLRDADALRANARDRKRAERHTLS